MWGISHFKKYKAWLLFHCKSGIVVLSICISTLFYFKFKKNKKEGQRIEKNNKLILRKMYIERLELSTPGSRGQCSNRYAVEDLKLGSQFFLFMDNHNTDKTVSTQLELLTCLPTLLNVII